VNDCLIEKNTERSYVSEVPVTAALDATNNSWGTDDPYEIGLSIYDYGDNHNRGTVNYLPFSDFEDGTPITTAPGGESYLAGVTRGDVTLSGSYVVPSFFLVQAGHTVTIAAGSTFKFMSESYLSVLGTLDAGDSSGGQVWGGIRFDDQSSGFLDNCVVEYAETGVSFYQRTSPRITNCEINKWGLHADSYGSHIPQPVVNDCLIEKNTERSYVSEVPSTTTLDATNNWWGTDDQTKIAETIWDYYDNNNVGIVNFEGWVNVFANFTAHPTIGKYPLSVQFTDRSVGSPTSWQWDFDNDGIIDSTEQNPTFIYETEGIYSVKLIDSNADASDEELKTDYINVFDLKAGFTANPTTATAPPLTVKFTDQSIGNPTSWQWDFDNDGIIDSTEQNPTFTYETADIYSVKLIAENADSADEMLKTDYIRVAAVTANFTADPTTGTAPLTVHFTDQSVGNITSWQWNFGNDDTSDLQNPSYTYKQPGTYTVSLTVSDGTNEDTKTRVINVSPPEQLIQADFIASPIYGVGSLTVQFTDRSSDSTTSWKWDFDNDDTSDLQNPSYTYEQPGTYTVSLTVSDGTNENTKTRTNYIKVDPEKEETSYYGKILTISPENSDGNENIQITGRAVERATGNSLSETLLNLVISRDGFERNYKIYTDNTGKFHHTFFPASDEFGSYKAWAVHPDVTDKTVQGEFAINRVIINPPVLDLNIPRNYEQKITINAEAGGTDLHNLQLVYDEADQTGGLFPKGIHVTTASPVAKVSSGESAAFDCTLWADKLADDNGKIVLRVKSDESDSWGTAVINMQISEAEPALFFTPDHLETGLALNESVTETIVLENKGLAGLSNVSLSLVNEDGTPAPEWVHLNSPADQGTIAVGEKREIGISFTSNPSQVTEGTYSFYLRVNSSNYPETDILLFVAVTQSGKGNVKFKVEDIYTQTTDPETGEEIQGLAGAEITVQNEKVLSVDQTKTTDSKGEVSFTDLPAGRYKYRVKAENHQEHIGRLWIRPGITLDENVFLGYDLVTVEWEVTETTIQDKYDIVLTATYETNVPAPVVVAEPASISIPDNIQPGDVFTGEITYTNYGLIRADELQFTFPETDEYFKYELLTKSFPTSLGAKEFFTVPYRITCLKNPRDRKRSGSSCRCYATGTRLAYTWICINGQWFKATLTVPMVECYGVCGGTGGGAWGGDGGSSSFQAIKGLFCPPERVCVPKDPCDCLDSSESTESRIDLLRGEYVDDVTDLSVKVPGYQLEVKRHHYDNTWHFDDLGQNLELIYVSGSAVEVVI